MPIKKTKKKRVKVSLTLTKDEARTLKLLSKYTGATRGEVVGYFLDPERTNVKKAKKELQELKEKERQLANEKLEEMFGSV